ncbi:MAG: hypothetical protein V5A68_06735, partial [Candidatus Thermoplasmatota archaeon]
FSKVLYIYDKYEVLPSNLRRNYFKMVVGFALINVDRPVTREMENEISEIEDVIENYPLLVDDTAEAEPFFENFEIIAKIEGDSVKNIRKVLDERINTLEGVKSSKLITRRNL